MLKIGDKITVRHSRQLAKSGNAILVNKSGEVTKVIYSNGRLLGAYADIKIMRRLKNYYIPSESIEGPESINRVRTLSILKTTVL